MNSKAITILIVFAGLCCAKGAPIAYLSASPAINLTALLERTIEGSTVHKIARWEGSGGASFAITITTPAIDERRELIHKLAGYLNLPTREIEHGMNQVRSLLSAQTTQMSFTFKTNAIIQWDEIGMEAKLARISSTQARFVLSNKYQGLVFTRKSEDVTSTLEVNPTGVSYTAQIPMENISVATILEGLNITNLVAEY